jgi:membrane protein required for colicin V production
VAVAFFVYQTVLSSQNVAMVDNSRSAIVFSRMADKIAERDPEATLSWVTSQYQQLVGECGAPE